MLRLDVPLGDPSVPLLRQRRRLAQALATLDAAQWAMPSRCADWSVQDVVAHLVGVNEFWSYSISSGLRRAPSRLLAAFDPVDTPPRLIEPLRDLGADEVLARFVATTEALADVLAGIDDDGWALVAESPPGHVPIGLVVLHGLWDGWVHERDILLPLGIEPVVKPDEVTASLQYAAVLGPTLLATGGSTRCGELAVEATEPDVRFVVEAGPTVVLRDGAPSASAIRLRGPAVGLVEGLSYRGAPLDLPADGRWLVDALGAAFEVDG